ncbi:MAG: LysR substrate-binding domain-containing protein [Candidatus Acidiferrum sp.]
MIFYRGKLKQWICWSAEKLDLIFHIDEGLLSSHFSSEKLYREAWICAVARQSKFGDRLNLKQYLAAEHLTVTTLPSVQNIPDKQLAALGAKRRSSVRMPYVGAALSCLPGTELVLTLTNGMRQMVKKNSTLRLVKAPQELRPFHFLMVWHPRLTTDARHTWLREAVRQVSPPEAFGQRLSHAHD